ncbi:peptidylprolyl isomerase [Limnohabitans sp. MMS-10A-160]|uniref:peptidylprolyl isomerase n=1 Tax=unclassified Limnohabitans TaxID=2626134 RepID=UPI000D3555C0|nr:MULTISPECIES: peptidylprolyl isomerase [unclassified Limnohabitans]PUE22298.1 peptidylprolyl isomerase [Limnohabitans sp. MMS-10A-192]PUE25946.1 peptidylprolyl isomerase [Limnohabitans sp. MMS-10A-160]
MFDSIRNHSKILMGLLFLLVIPSFVLFGMDSYSRFSDQGAPVAKVAGNKITQGEWDAAHQREVERIRASVPNLDPKLLDSVEARYATLERMVNDRVIAAAADKQLLITSDQRLARYLQQDPSIAGLRGADGKLDMERYRQLAASQGMTPEMLEAKVRQDLSAQQVMGGLQQSVVASQSQTDTALNAYLQRREIQIQKWTPADFAAKVQVADADLEKFYQAQSERFRSVESADIEYLVLDTASLQKSISLPEQDLKTYYEQNVQRLAGKEERRASHILINAAKDAPAADRAKAKAKAEELLAAVRKSPKSFADVARKNSQDTGSATRGGDLDFFAKGAMVKAFEDAAFALKKGDISDVVESEFGFHIIELTDIKAPKAPSFESMRPQLEADLRKQQAQRQFAEQAETFSNSVYEQAESFKPTADRLKLTVQKAQGLTRTPAAGAQGVLANAKLLQTLFAEESVSKRRNTAAVEVAPNTLVSARIVAYRPAAVRPFAEVKDEVRRQYVVEKSADLAKAEGQAKLASWKDQAAQAQVGAAVIVSRDQTQGQAQAVVDAVLRADPARLPALVGVDLGTQGFVVARVNKLVPRDASSAQQLAQSRQQMTQLWGQAEGQAYLTYLKQQLKAEILIEKPQSQRAEAAEKR